MTAVIDSSITLAWYFEDERTDAVRAVLDHVADAGAVAPGLWRYEVANGMQAALRRNRIDAAYRDHALASLGALDIEIDEDCDQQVWAATLRLADLYQLTVYDAAYLELAQRRRLSLATLDRALANAARTAGVEVWP